MSHLGVDADTLVATIREADPDAVVVAIATPLHRGAVEGLVLEMPVLRPMFVDVRNNRGAIEKRSAGASQRSADLLLEQYTAQPPASQTCNAVQPE